MAQDVEQVARAVVEQLARAWNAGDGDAFAAPFADDADFVTVRGEYYRTRAGVAHGHRVILSTIYKGSTNRLELVRARPLGDGLIVAHARSALLVPAGPLAGEHRAVMSMLLVRAEDRWEIASFHNTFRMASAPLRDELLQQFKDYAAE